MKKQPISFQLIFLTNFCHSKVTDQCLYQPCKYGGTCKPVGTTSYTCTCMNGITGLNCETSKNFFETYNLYNANTLSALYKIMFMSLPRHMVFTIYFHNLSTEKGKPIFLSATALFFYLCFACGLRLENDAVRTVVALRLRINLCDCPSDFMNSFFIDQLHFPGPHLQSELFEP